MAGHNPFLPHKPAVGPKAFWGRHREQRLLASYVLDSEQPQSCIIVGPPFSGKTSLLHALLTQQPEHSPTKHARQPARIVELLLPMNELVTARADRFYQRLLQGVRQRLNALAAQGQPRVALNTHSSTKESGAVLEQFDHALAEATAAGYRFHFLLDDFATVAQNPTAFDESFFTQLRSSAQLYNVSWLIASERPVLELWPEGDLAHHPFFSLLRHITLGPLPEDEADELLDETARHAGHSLTVEERQALVRLAGPHPAFLQLAGWHFYESRFVRRMRTSAALSDATFRYTAAARATYTKLWDMLTAAERQWLLQKVKEHDEAASTPSGEEEERWQALAQRTGLLVPAEEGRGYALCGEGLATFLRELPPDSEYTVEGEYQELSQLVAQYAASHDERGRIDAVLAQFRQGNYEIGLSALFPVLEKIAGELIKERTRRVPPLLLGARLEELRHLGAISQETLELGMQLIPERNSAAHGRAIANAEQVARSTIKLGRRLLQEAHRS
jgi:hypothetical protein